MAQETASDSKNTHRFLNGGGQMELLIRSFDWKNTSISTIEEWPQSLRTTVNIILHSPLPMVLLWGNDGIMIYNDSYSVFAGARHPSLLGSKVVEGWPEVADFNRNVMAIGLQGESLTYKDQKLTLYRNNVAEEVWMDLNYSPVMDEAGAPAGVLAIVVETSQRILAEQHKVQAEEALRHSEAHLRALVTATSDIIYRANADWSELSLVDGRDFLADDEEPIRDWQQRYQHPKDHEFVMSAIRKAIETKTPFQLEHPVIDKSGNLGWTFSRAIPILGANGEILEWFGIASDVTERKRSEEALKKSEERFRLQADAAPNFVWTLGPDGGVTYMNEYGLKFFNYSMDNLTSWVPLVHPDDIEPATRLLQEAYSNRAKYEFEHRIKRADGEYFWVISTANPAILSNGELFGYVGSSTDINERKQMEEALKESESRFRTMAEGAEILIATTDEMGNASYFNKAWSDFTGRNMDYLLNYGWADLLHEEDKQPFLDIYLKAFEKKGPFRGEFRILTKTDTYKWLLGIGSPRFHTNGSFAGFISSSIDISDRKQAEEDLKSKNEQLVRINNDLDNFIYTASHDLKSPISNIEGLLIALQSCLHLDDHSKDEVKKILLLMEKSINRFKSTILDLTEISKVQKVQEEDVIKIDLLEILDDIKLSIYDKIAETRATIETDFSFCGSIRFSKKNLKSILYNLISNAIKYRDASKTPKIFIKTEVKEDYTILIVRDNGLGISEQNQKKMFSMFKRFHDHVEGTGIGLYIVKRIIDNAGGKIEVESQVGNGTTLKIYFSNQTT